MSLRFSLTMMVVDDMTVSRGLVEQALDEIGIQKVQYENNGEAALISTCRVWMGFPCWKRCG